MCAVNDPTWRESLERPTHHETNDAQHAAGGSDYGEAYDALVHLPINARFDGGDWALNDRLGRCERADHDVVPIRITQCEFSGAGIGAHVRFLFQLGDEGARSKQRLIEVVDTKEQE